MIFRMNTGKTDLSVLNVSIARIKRVEKKSNDILTNAESSTPTALFEISQFREDSGGANSAVMEVMLIT
jgi:hypothetical protein